ncbi:MAG TPA: hypothetical protein VLB27_03245, partial [candidate division Zixibacteria bacterium]|nr:hypothetical protein [candidate division Zixibacteria bacterium]
MNYLNPHHLCRRAARLQSLLACGTLALTMSLAPQSAPAQTASSSSRTTSKASQNRSQNIIVAFERLHRGELAVDGFELTEQTRLDLYAIGAAPGRSDDLSAYAWIIDAQTRQPVWVMEERDTDRYQRSSDLREIDDQITLQPGRYEAYYFVGQNYSFNGNVNIKDLEGFEEFFEELGVALAELGEELGDEIEEALDDDDDADADADRNDRWRDRIKRDIRDGIERDRNRDWRFGLSDRDLDELRFEVSADRAGFTKFDPQKTNYELAVADFTKVGNDERLRKGFTLSRETTLKVRACGEYSESGNIFVDYGWIVDANSRKRVWEMDKWSTRYAGGARKNRFADEEITLAAGDYLVYFMTDDSHSF